MEQNTQNTKTITPETSYFIGALETILNAESKVIDGYSELYGDGCGNGEGMDQYSKSPLWQRFEDLKTAIKLQIGFSIELNLGYIKENRI